MRKLATIRQIADIRPIPGADAIECAVVDGWTVVIKKGEYKPGDIAVYCEVDSWIPHELAPFLSKGQEPREYNGIKGERLKTVKLRGQLSQGLLLSRYVALDKIGEIEQGMDVSDILNIQKWEAPIPAQLAGTVKGSFPTQVPKTDEERIQNLTDKWNELNSFTYEITEKLEGSSMSVGILNGEFIVCSRNLNLKETEGNTFWSVARKNDIENKMRKLGIDNLILQGELIGEGVQGNHYNLRGQDFYVFAVYDVVNGIYLHPSQRRNLAMLQLQLNHVPVIEPVIDIGEKTIDEILNMADGQSILNKNVLREGLVFKQLNGQAHWKAVSNKYLLKHG